MAHRVGDEVARRALDEPAAAHRAAERRAVDVLVGDEARVIARRVEAGRRRGVPCVVALAVDRGRRVARRHVEPRLHRVVVPHQLGERRGALVDRAVEVVVRRRVRGRAREERAVAPERELDLHHLDAERRGGRRRVDVVAGEGAQQRGRPAPRQLVVDALHVDHRGEADDLAREDLPQLVADHARAAVAELGEVRAREHDDRVGRLAVGQPVQRGERAVDRALERAPRARQRADVDEVDALLPVAPKARRGVHQREERDARAADVDERPRPHVRRAERGAREVEVRRDRGRQAGVERAQPVDVARERRARVGRARREVAPVQAVRVVPGRREVARGRVPAEGRVREPAAEEEAAHVDDRGAVRRARAQLGDLRRAARRAAVAVARRRVERRGRAHRAPAVHREHRAAHLVRDEQLDRRLGRRRTRR